jgi:CO dehydrogenase maturation factor
MIVITDASKRGLGTAKRIKKLAQELEVKFKDIYVVANKVKPEYEELIESYAKELGLNLIGKLPYNKKIAEYDLKGIPLWNLPDDNEVYKKVEEIAEKILKNRK